MTYFFPHAGQLRYHDFQKLREINQARQQRYMKNSIKKISSSSNANRRAHLFYTSNSQQNSLGQKFRSLDLGVGYDQTRSFWSMVTSPNQFVTNIQLKSLEYAANDNPEDPVAQYNFLSELAKHHPEIVIQRCTHPSFKNMAINVPSAVLLLQCIQHTQKGFYDLDTLELIHRIKKTNPDPQQKEALATLKHRFQHDKLPKEQQLNELLHILTTPAAAAAMSTGTGAAATAAAAAGRSQLPPPTVGGPPIGAGSGVNAIGGLRGSDPRYPLHVQMHQQMSTRAAIFGIAGRVLLVFVVVSAVGAMLDDKGVGRAMGMNNSSKHIQEAEAPINVKFEDVKGVEEAKAELEEIVLYLKDPSKFTRLGGKLPRGLLLTGPPGTGKTMLAKAIAGEADVPFFFSSGSQFEEVYVGLGAKRVRELFETAKKKSPSIIFIDEIDAIGGTRRLKDQSALKMTLNELLVQLDGFDENNGIIVIGATNFMQSLDPALLRPGRFDKHVTVPLPDVGGRKEILEMYARKTKLSKDVDLTVLARGTTGFSGADLYNLMNQAALKASVDGLNSINMAVLEYAKDKIMMGAERKTAVVTPATAKCTAYHEAGHALVATLTEGAQPIHKATIMPRGSALGMVTLLPEGDQLSQSLKQMLAFMDVAMGGRVAEELIFGKEQVTSGAMSDIANATKVARNMVTKYGFSEEVGIVYHGGQSGEESASDETRAQIDAEVKRLTDQSYARVKELLMKHKNEHHLLAKTLLEYETLTGDEVRSLVRKGKKPSRPIVNKDGGRRGDPKLMGSSGSRTTATGGLAGSMGNQRS